MVWWIDNIDCRPIVMVTCPLNKSPLAAANKGRECLANLTGGLDHMTPEIPRINSKKGKNLIGKGLIDILSKAANKDINN
jgi:hypothetical protein